MTRIHVGGKSVVKNAARNLAGQVLPFAVAIYCIPKLIEVLGVERFGFLALIWVVVGYLSIFDLGLGQALTKLVAERIGKGEQEHIPSLFWTAFWLMCGLGVFGLVVAEIVIFNLDIGILNVPIVFQNEALAALKIVAISLPFVIASSGARGMLEAHQRFDLVNWVRAPLGIYTFAAPLFVAHYLSNDLSAIAWVLLLGRVMFLCCTMWLCIKTIPSLRRIEKIQSGLLKTLFGFGGWMTVANLVGPMMTYLDRFIIGAFVSMAAVAYYVTPYEMVTKLWILPGALTGVLFTAFAINLNQDKEKAVRLFGRSMDGIFLLMLPIIILLIAFAREILDLWLGSDFASHSVVIFQVLAIGVFINSIGRVLFVFIQAAHRPDIPALLYLIELPLYLLSIWFMLHKFGVEGAAIAWVARIVLDNLVLLFACVRIVPQLKPDLWRGVWMTLLPCIFLSLEMVMVGRNAQISMVALSLLLSAFGIYWFKRNWKTRLPMVSVRN